MFTPRFEFIACMILLGIWAIIGVVIFYGFATELY
jgi:hypothetical protein